jgi:peroxiredoxin Q/BCP
MAQLRQDYERFVELQTEIIVVGPESAESFQRYWEEEHLPFIGLPDPEQTVLNLYGQEVRLVKLGRLPALMLVDTSGRLRYVHYGHSMTDIPDNEEILELLATDSPIGGSRVG